jgi:hypothetical protein
MSSKVDSAALQKYLMIGGGLAAAYFLTHYLAQRNPSAKAIPLEITLNLLKEIKYQVYATCIAFAEGVNAKLKANYPAKDLEVFLRTELTKNYEAKEELILNKHIISKDEYANALKKYKKNPQVAADQAEIIKVLEDSVKGQVDLTVPVAVSQLFSRQQLLSTYRLMCEEIGVKVWEKLLDCKRNNPGFDSSNDAHFKSAIRELGIYEFKVKHLT